MFGIDPLLEALKKLLDGGGAVLADQFILAYEADCSCEDFVKVENCCVVDLPSQKQSPTRTLLCYALHLISELVSASSTNSGRKEGCGLLI